MSSRFASWVVGRVSIPQARQQQQELDLQRIYILTRLNQAFAQGKSARMPMLLHEVRGCRSCTYPQLHVRQGKSPDQQNFRVFSSIIPKSCLLCIQRCITLTPSNQYKPMRGAITTTNYCCNRSLWSFPSTDHTQIPLYSISLPLLHLPPSPYFSVPAPATEPISRALNHPARGRGGAAASGAGRS